MRFLAPYQANILGILRIMSGLLFLEHGTAKLLGWPVTQPREIPPEFVPIILAAGVIELVTGVLITAGFQTRIAAFIASGTMAVAYWLGHFAASGQFFPVQNGGDAAILFCFVFLYLCAAGPGSFALDRK